MVRRLFSLVVLAAALPVLAQTQPVPPSTPSPARPPPAQNVDFFEGDVIDGTLASSDLGAIYTVPPPKFRSLIHIRENFNDKLTTAVNM